MPTWLVPVALVVAAMAIVALLVVVLTGGGDGDRTTVIREPKQDEVLLEPINAPVPDPFTERVTVGTETRVTTSALPATVPARAATGGQVAGSAPGLYGGSGNTRVCDREQLIRFLGANAAKARAWAGVVGTTPAGIRAYVMSLTPVLLTRDTLVLNHGFSNGRATPRNAVLQAGTAVLVDQFGIPRVKCNCGNPLAEPTITSPTKVVGTRWPGFSTTKILLVVPDVEVSSFVIVDIDTGALTSRPVGTDGDQDGAVLIDELCSLVPDDPQCTAVEPGPLPTSPEPSTGATNTPEDAIGEALAAAGYDYLGDCSLADNAGDEVYGMYCSVLYEDNGSYRVYGIGPVASEPSDTVNVTIEGGRWVVID